jgi:hypothetical protein
VLHVRAGRDGYRTYLKFRVTGLTGRIASARLQLRALRPYRGRGIVFLASNRWNEPRLAWRSAPRALGSLRLALPGAARAGVVDVDVRAIVTGDGTYTLALAGTRGGGASFSSSEGAGSPQLVLTVQ